MKKYFSNIFCLTVLIPALLFCSLPVIQPEDADRNGLIGLEDVILSIRSLAENDGDVFSFRSDFRKAVASLSIAAGLKTVIKASEERADAASFQWFFLIAFSGVLVCPSGFSELFQKDVLYKSYVILPDFPPPRLF